VGAEAWELAEERREAVVGGAASAPREEEEDVGGQGVMLRETIEGEEEADLVFLNRDAAGHEEDPFVWI